MPDKDPTDEKVGYGRPPRRHQFKKGRSGNPWGRPRSQWPDRPSLMRALMEPVVIRANGQSKTVPRAEALVHVSMEKALQGDAKATQLLLGIMDKCGLFTPEQPKASDYETAKERLEKKLQQMHERFMAGEEMGLDSKEELGDD